MKNLYIPEYDISTGSVISWEEITGKSLKEIYGKMCRRLSCDKRTEKAYEEKNDSWEPKIVCSLYEGMSRIGSRKL